MGVQMGVVRPEHVANTIRMFASVSEFKNPDEFCDAQPQGVPNPEQFQQMQQQQQEQQQKMGQEMQRLQQDNQRLQQENFAVKADAQLTKIDAAKRVFAADAKGTPEMPEDNSAEWAKIDIQRFDSITKRMALGYEVNEADRQFALSHFQTMNDAAMAHRQQSHAEVTARQDAETATDGGAPY
jgi:hypothetical protein